MLGVMLDKNLRPAPKGQSRVNGRPSSRGEETAQGLVGQLLNRVFDGSAKRLVVHLVDAGALSERELLELKSALDQDSNASVASGLEDGDEHRHDSNGRRMVGRRVDDGPSSFGSGRLS